MEILIPILILSAIAIICAVLLTVANHFFGVEVDEREAAVRDCLPGANCGACGYSGCDGYAPPSHIGERVVLVNTEKRRKPPWLKQILKN